MPGQKRLSSETPTTRPRKRARTEPPVTYSESLKQQADAGNATAQYRLGCCYENGWGTEITPQKAFEYYQQAADPNHPLIPALYKLGCCHENGLGTRINLQKAFKYYQQAADHGYPPALYALGLCYENGWGTATDLAQAQIQFEVAAARSKEESLRDKAKERLERIDSNTSGHKVSQSVSSSNEGRSSSAESETLKAKIVSLSNPRVNPPIHRCRLQSSGSN